MTRATALLLVLFLVSCKRSEDQAAKQRIFSPEEPVGALAEAKESLDAGRLADDPRLSERVVRMPQAEAAARLGAHKAQTRVQLDRKSTRLNSSHTVISYAVFCLKKKKQPEAAAT